MVKIKDTQFCVKILKMKRKKGQNFLTFRSGDSNFRFSVIFPSMIWIFIGEELKLLFWIHSKWFRTIWDSCKFEKEIPCQNMVRIFAKFPTVCSRLVGISAIRTMCISPKLFQTGWCSTFSQFCISNIIHRPQWFNWNSVSQFCRNTGLRMWRATIMPFNKWIFTFCITSCLGSKKESFLAKN